MTFSEIISKTNLTYKEISGNSRSEITGIRISSRECGNGDVFAAIKGFKTDGHLFAEDAFSRGCRNFIVTDPAAIPQNITHSSTVYQVDDAREALALCSNALYDSPFNELYMIGITGSKGKTTTTFLIDAIFRRVTKNSLFTTVKYRSGDIEEASERTTMEADRLQKLLRDSVNHGDTHAIVEVSSHAVTLKRIAGVEWDAGVFTSFSRDHLDLYGTMENYLEAKLDFFRMLSASSKKNKIAVINMDDPEGHKVLGVLNDSVRAVTIGHSDKCSYRIDDVASDGDKQIIELTLNTPILTAKERYDVPLMGDYNVTNIVLAIACARENGIPYEDVYAALHDFSGVDGRFNIVINSPFKVVVDYAHTPESLEKIFTECRKLASGRVIAVFGCTGDRDREKRPIMGETAAEFADYSIITDDDTYTEDPDVIIGMLEAGFISSGKRSPSNYRIVRDRRSAIADALRMAAPGDVIVIAGMGHQKYQITGNGKIPHNDRECVLELYHK